MAVASAAGMGLDFFLSGDAAVVNAIVLGSLPLKLCCCRSPQMSVPTRSFALLCFEL